MKHALLTLLALLVPLCATGAGQDEKREARAFRKDFAQSPQRPRTAEQRHQALERLAEVDGEEVAVALVEAARGLAAEILAIETGRRAIQDEIAQLIAGQEAAKNRTLPKPQYDRYHELRRQSEAQRQALDELRGLAAAVNARIARLGAADALRWLVEDALKDRRVDIDVKLAIARAAGRAEDLLLADVVAALKRAREPGQVIGLLDAIALGGPSAREAAPLVVERLRDEDGRIRERAALALAKLAAPDGIEPMIALLERERGAARKSIAGALEVLTGQQLGTNAASWRAWFAAEGAEFQSGARPLGQGRPSRKTSEDRGYYFEIPQDGKSMVYVIDASGSMEKEIEWRTPGTSAGKDRSTRLEACKAELIRALAALPSDAHFNLIWYSDLPYLYDPRMQPAQPAAIEKAQAWVRQLTPAGSTNIHDALQTAFRLTGQGAKDRHYELEVDMVFLLTDGSPTKPDGSLDSTDEILAAVRAWNPLQRVTIHTIGIGGELNTAFLQQLATENGGEFRQR
jgi:Mg-chelatase subunit ChlD